ncbi:hypothetical protein Q9189_007692, partial [Teloschistes chrysophthalmus]
MGHRARAARTLPARMLGLMKYVAALPDDWTTSLEVVLTIYNTWVNRVYRWKNKPPGAVIGQEDDNMDNQFADAARSEATSEFIGAHIFDRI